MNLTFPWQQSLLESILETDNSKLPQRIAAAESAIKLRVAELAQDHRGSPEEQRAVAQALIDLEILRKERVGA